MSRSVNSLALKIAQILEEHTDEEIGAALEMLSRFGHGGDLLKRLAKERVARPPASEKKRQPLQTRGTKPIEETVSRAVLKLQTEAPEKFQILSEFDQLVRSGKALESNLALRQFGAKVSKGFRPGKSRKESISAVMTVLSDRSLEDIQQLIDQAVSAETPTTEGEFQRLAKFLIKGRS